MIVIDDSKFPLVWLNQVNNTNELDNQSDDANNSFYHLEVLLEKKVPFILISASDYEKKENHEHSKNEKMIMVQWMKNHKKDVRNFIIAQIQVITKEEQTILLRGYSKIFSKFWGFPLIIVNNEESAIVKARELLNKAQSKT